jgi:hypothetical protein
MKLFEKLYKRAQKESKFFNKREIYPSDSFRVKISYAAQILNIVENHTKERKIKIEARKNFIVNCVTATEVYFKDIVKTLPEFPKIKENGEGIKELLKEKISLWEAYLLFKKEDLRIGDVIYSYYSFQNLEEIDSVMSKILNLKFLDSVEKHKANLDREDQKYYGVKTLCLKTDLPKWRNYLAEIFNLRHDFIHHISFKDRIGFQKLGILWEHLDAFITVVDDFVLQYVPTD